MDEGRLANVADVRGRSPQAVDDDEKVSRVRWHGFDGMRRKESKL